MMSNDNAGDNSQIMMRICRVLEMSLCPTNQRRCCKHRMRDLNYALNSTCSHIVYKIILMA